MIHKKASVKKKILLKNKKLRLYFKTYYVDFKHFINRIQNSELFNYIIFIYLINSYELVCCKNKTKRRIQSFEFF